MKQNTFAWLIIGSILAVITAGAWFFMTAYASALEGATPAATTVKAVDGISGSEKQSDKPVISPLGSAAGGIVDAKNMTVAQVVAALDGTSKFQSLFAQANGRAAVSGEGDYTVFVPTDGAFSQLPKGAIADTNNLVRYHIVDHAIDTDAIVAGSVQTSLGALLNFSFGANKLPMVGNAIVITQFNAKNGVVYTIDNVLLPPGK